MLRVDDTILLTPAQMAAADAAAIRAGIDENTLMEAAGRAVARAVARHNQRAPVVVLCGPGNNGGDGFVAARYLRSEGWPVRLGLLGSVERLRGAAAYHAGLWRGEVEPLTPALLDGAGVVVDALFGAGLNAPIQGEAHRTLTALAQSGLPVCAVDVPSGLDGQTGEVQGLAVPARHTVTFFRKKPGHLLLPGRSLCGRLEVADIGIPVQVLQGLGANAHENTPALWSDAYPWPGESGHKYHRGHVLVAGGADMTGAARLAALAAARIGAGLVSVAAPASVWQVYAMALTSVMVHAVANEDDLQQLLADERRNVLVAGPGAGASPGTRRQVLAMLATRRGVVLDADALTAFRDQPAELLDAIAGPCVLTPHEGEFERIFSCTGDKLERARQAARRSGAVVVLKGADTVVAAPDGRASINTNAPPQLATGGTGDVLTGMVAGLMAQGMPPYPAASAAVWLHGEAARRFGPGLVSSDLPDMLPRVLRRLKAGSASS